MAVKAMEVGDLAACCYIVYGGGAGSGPKPCVVIDPGGEADRINAAVGKLGLKVEAVFLTHSHADHIGGVDGVLAGWPEAVLLCSAETSRRAGDPRLNLSVFIGEPVAVGPAGRTLADGEKFSSAGLDWRAVEVPGHEPGEMVYILGDGREVFTGDTVFNGSIGRSDFPGGDGRALVAGVRHLLESLSPDAKLYPGHGPATTVAAELSHNPFLR